MKLGFDKSLFLNLNKVIKECMQIQPNERLRLNRVWRALNDTDSISLSRTESTADKFAPPELDFNKRPFSAVINLPQLPFIPRAKY